LLENLHDRVNRLVWQSHAQERDLTTKWFMSLRSPTEHEKPAFVMPTWIAGIQIRKDASGDIHVDLIPAFHAGMTELKIAALN